MKSFLGLFTFLIFVISIIGFITLNYADDNKYYRILIRSKLVEMELRLEINSFNYKQKIPQIHFE